jgi:aspartokinase/homoserine dehydrogenase 1
MLVLKFGGTSVGSVEAIRQVAAILQNKKGRYVVVFSAMSGVTNTLIELGETASRSEESYRKTLQQLELKHVQVAKELCQVKNQSRVLAQIKVLFNELEDLLHGVFLIKELSLRTKDIIQSFGERLSSFLVSEYLKQEGLNIGFMDARQFIRTDDQFGSAIVDVKTTNALIAEVWKKHKGSLVTTGFIGSTAKGETTTLGRGGSDYTASIIGAALEASEIEIWTDVNGVMTADPKKVKSAFTLPSMSYVEAMEVSHFGAKVIYPPTLAPAFAQRIPIRILNTFQPEEEGTLISDKVVSADYVIKGITSIDNISLINLQGPGMVGVPGVSARFFGALGRAKVNIILITQASSEHSICIIIDHKDAQKALQAIATEFTHEIREGKINKPSDQSGLSVLAIIGDNMRNTPGISAKLFNALGKNNVNVVAIAQGSSERNLSVVIPQKDLSKALNTIHESFFADDVKTLHVFVVGLGLIGSTLLKQIKNQHAALIKERQLKINIVGIANTKKMLIQENGIALSNWQDKLESVGEKANLKTFVAKMKELNLSNTIFVDNTSSKEVVALYEEIIGSRVSIVTPNKLANSGPLEAYQSLHNLAFKTKAKLLYETNVGAGLPVINTLQDLIYSGDKILKIEGVLSGTLSFIFNSYKAGLSFSDVVMQAKEKGFTEPDPRDDLNGMDVARKILILAREAGADLEPSDVVVENILPESCRKAKTVNDFFKELEKNNHVFDKMREDAEKKGKVLRFIARWEKGKASVSLLAVGADHPFYSLSGSDNIIAFTTDRYKDRPLVIKGPGAGAEVTAAGVFAQVISLSNYLHN